MQPGGHVELQENPWQGVLHEITEETGYSLEQLTVLQPKQRLLKLTRAVLHPVSVCDNTHEADDGHYHSDRTYAFAVDTEPVNVPSEGESTIFQWVTAVELANMKDSEVGTQLKEIGAYALTVCASEWERVPLSEFEA